MFVCQKNAWKSTGDYKKADESEIGMISGHARGQPLVFTVSVMIHRVRNNISDLAICENQTHESGSQGAERLPVLTILALKPSRRSVLGVRKAILSTTLLILLFNLLSMMSRVFQKF